MEIFTSIETWFGYVGACAVSPDATCRPLLAFLALGAAATAALALVVIAYRTAAARDAAARDARQSDARGPTPHDRARRSLAEKGFGPKHVPHNRLPLAA